MRDNLTWSTVQHDTPRAQWGDGVHCEAEKKRGDIGLWGVQTILQNLIWAAVVNKKVTFTA